MQSCPTIFGLPQPISEFMSKAYIQSLCPNHTEILVHMSTSIFTILKRKHPLGIAVKEIYLAIDNMGCYLL